MARRIPMRERIDMALKELDKPVKPYTQRQLAECLDWNLSTTQRVVNSDNRVLVKLMENRPPKKVRLKRPLRQKPNLAPIIKLLFNAIQDSGMSYVEVARKSGMSTQFFRDVFHYGHLPRLDSLLAVCEVIGYELTMMESTNG